MITNKVDSKWSILIKKTYNGLECHTNNLLLWKTKWVQLSFRIWLEFRANNELWNKMEIVGKNKSEDDKIL